MIEVVTLNYLNEHLTVPAFLEKPSEAPERYVLIDKTGGGKSNHLPSSTFAFQSYAESKYQASALNEEVKDVVEQMIILDVIRGIHLNSDYNYTDPTTKQYRYQAVFDINHY